MRNDRLTSVDMGELDNAHQSPSKLKTRISSRYVDRFLKDAELNYEIDTREAVEKSFRRSLNESFGTELSAQDQELKAKILNGFEQIFSAKEDGTLRVKTNKQLEKALHHGKNFNEPPFVETGTEGYDDPKYLEAKTKAYEHAVQKFEHCTAEVGHGKISWG